MTGQSTLKKFERVIASVGFLTNRYYGSIHEFTYDLTKFCVNSDDSLCCSRIQVNLKLREKAGKTIKMLPR